MDVVPLKPFGIAITNFSVRNAPEDELRRFEAAFGEHSLIVLRGMNGMSGDEQVQLLGRLGPVAVENFGGERTSFVEHNPASPTTPEFTRGELLFHSDVAFTEKWLLWIISLFGEKVTTQGGETRFTHTGRALRRLSPETRSAIAGKRAVHLFDPYGRSSERPTEESLGKSAERGIHEIVRAHPYGNGEVLTVNYAMTDRIVGLPRSDSATLLQTLFDALYAPEMIYTHSWQAGDLLVWDNRVVQHARNDFDPSEHRVLRRVAIGDETSLQYLFRRWADQIPAA